MKNFSESNKPEPPMDFDLPDWSGADGLGGRVSPETAYRLCEEYAEFMPGTVQELRSRRHQPCSVEFVL